jgi:ABC-type uncharacterized transport system permease subunit
MLPLTFAAIALYLAAAALLARPVLDGREAPRAAALGVATLAVLAHAGEIALAHRGALDLHFFAALSLIACVIAALTLIVNLWRPVAALGVILFPLAAALLAVDVFLAPPTAPLALDWQIKLHVTLALLSYGLLSIAALLALLLAFQERSLRRHRMPAFLAALPPLTLTESLMFRLIGAGFALLSLTLLSGALFVTNLFDQHLVHKTVLSILAWLVFGVLLLGRWRWGWRGRQAVWLTLAGMAVLILAFFGSKFVLELLLRRSA